MALTALLAMQTALVVLLDRKELEFPLINEPVALLLAMFVLLVPEAVLAMPTAPPVSREPTLSETLTLALDAPLVRKARMALLRATPLPMVVTLAPLASSLVYLVRLIAPLV